MSGSMRFDWLCRPHSADEDPPLSNNAARFAKALAELPAIQRSALALSRIGGMDADAIAQRLGTDPAIVQRLLARARESVRASIAPLPAPSPVLFRVPSALHRPPAAPHARMDSFDSGSSGT